MLRRGFRAASSWSRFTEMSRYTMELIMDKWVKPSVDISKWEFYDLSCQDSDDVSLDLLGLQLLRLVDR
eukprot:Skav211820  [mRNA]  locus=scaffold305:579974:580782:- [translate_table: standard]